MSNTFISLCGAVLVGSLVFAITAKVLFLLRWHLFGWRPAILDQKLVDKCVEQSARFALNYAVQDAKENHGYTLSDAEQQSFHKMAADSYRSVLENYIVQFSLLGR